MNDSATVDAYGFSYEDDEELSPCDMDSVNFNCSLDDYLYYMLGPRQLPLAYAIPVTVAYTVIFFTGVLGNAAVCVVIAKHPSMHTATNYYLFSLAVSDLMLLLLGKSLLDNHIYYIQIVGVVLIYTLK